MPWTYRRVKREWLILLIMILIGLGLAGIAFWVGKQLISNDKPNYTDSNSNQQTSNLQSPVASQSVNSSSNPMHRNTNYRIGLSHPSSWELRKERQDYPPSALTGQKILFQILAPNEKEGSYRENVLVKIEQVEQTPYLNEYADVQRVRIKQLGTFDVEDDRQITIDGQNAHEIVYSGDNGQYNLKRRRIIVLPKTPSVPPYVLLITYTADVNDYEQYLSEVEQIVKSIQLN